MSGLFDPSGREILRYVGPPAAGAVIGYVTNAVAIRMLFRPLRQWTFLGVRVPLTPGIIPKRREELARNIGKMVGQHLLTSDEILTALDLPSFGQGLEKAVHSFMARLWNIDLGSIGGLEEGPARGISGEVLVSLRRGLTEALGTPAVIRIAGEAFGDFYDRILAHRPDELVWWEGEDMVQAFGGVVTHVLEAPPTRRIVARTVSELLFTRVRDAATLRELIPEDLYGMLRRSVEREAPPLLERFSRLLEDDDVRSRMNTAVYHAVNESIREAGVIARFVRVLVGESNIENRLEETVDKLRVEAIRWMREEGTAARVSEIVGARLDVVFQGDLQKVLARIPEERLEAARQFTERHLESMLAEPALGAMATEWFRDALATRMNRPLGEIVDEVFGEGSAGLGRRSFVEAAGKLFQGESRVAWSGGSGARLIKAMLGQLMTGTLTDRLPRRVRRKIEILAQAQAREFLAREVPELVDTFDIEGIVEARINRLDILKVEDLIEGIMREQLAYINLFGALLGFLLGLVNLLWI